MMYGTLLFYVFPSVSCYVISDSFSNSNASQLIPVNIGKFPEIWDWRDRKMVSPVKDQFGCNACWAFSAVANIESHLKIYLGIEEQLSEQFLIDCDGSGVGCGSASVLYSFGRIVNKLGGVLRSSDYEPYSGRQRPCSWKDQTPKPVPVTGYRRVRSDEEDMARAVYKYGPLSAGINSASMKTYEGGIDEPKDELCAPTDLDHAVLIVGYNVYLNRNTGERVPYWIIKNSWGVNWGDAGFYYLVRGRNACGIANDVSFATVN
ncbi:putative cysteine proteinase CG12163 [Bicyclus anynana]|uniref:Cysteine proteinase CG12163 n=1 Tax=Bicyclus anynana TaxID=110368 RepID=A0A6J1P1U3_BICAN|nr:putative cysteine proteinase CG12163 [Bicyclus anynana]